MALAAAASAAAPLVIATPLTSNGSSHAETNFGDLVADAVKATDQTCDMAMVPSTEIKEVTIPSGNASTDDIEQVLRAEDDTQDTVVMLRLTGAQVRQAIERSISHAPEPFAGFLQVAGLRVTYASTAAAGSRVTSLTLVSTGKSIEQGTYYRVATTRLLADGSLGYFVIWNSADIASDTHVPIGKSLADYAQAHQPVSAQLEGRIVAK